MQRLVTSLHIIYRCLWQYHCCRRSESSNQTTITNGTTASNDNSASESGAAHVFVRSGTTWAQQAYLKAPNAAANDKFGVSVSVLWIPLWWCYARRFSQTSITNGTTVGADPGTASAQVPPTSLYARATIAIFLQS